MKKYVILFFAVVFLFGCNDSSETKQLMSSTSREIAIVEDGGDHAGNGGFAYEKSYELIELAADSLIVKVADSPFPLFEKFPERREVLLNVLEFNNIVQLPNVEDVYRGGKLLALDYTTTPVKAIKLYRPFYEQFAGTLGVNMKDAQNEVELLFLHEAAHLWGYNDPAARKFALDFLKGGLSIDSEPTLPQTIACSSSIECIKRGFDCCNDGSCINGGTLKFNAELLPEYNLAMSDITINPLAYKKYPEIFYICQETEITGDASEVRLDRHATWGEIQSDASKVCKGKGWIRRFAKSTDKWPVKNRLSFDPLSFKCLNYENEIALLDRSQLADYNIGTMNFFDQSRLSLNVSIGGSMEVEIDQLTSFELWAPRYADYSIKVMNTLPVDRDGVVYQQVSQDAPYMPTPYFTNLYTEKPVYNYFTENDGEKSSVSFILPVYIGGKNNIRSVQIKYISADQTGSLLDGDLITAEKFVGECQFENLDQVVDRMEPQSYCIDSITKPGYDIFHITADPDVLVTGERWYRAGVVVRFNGANTPSYVYSTGVDPSRIGQKSGNALYYLNGLSRFELLGVPQISYAPIYCNSNRNRLVEGIYQPELKTREDISDQSELDSAMVYKKDIFSSDKFSCCVPLGNLTSSKLNCCSGHGVRSRDKSELYTCMLPTGTDLNVYFNRFISDEGDEILSNKDFRSNTGELKLDHDSYIKLLSLGKKYCESGAIKTGGAFGHFYAGNSSTFNSYGIENGSCSYRQFQIVDSVSDEASEDYDSCNTDKSVIPVDQKARTGYREFSAGYRWNHHYYCAP